MSKSVADVLVGVLEQVGVKQIFGDGACPIRDGLVEGRQDFPP